MSPRSLFVVPGMLCVLAAPCAASHWLRAESPRFVLYAQADQDSILRLANSLDGMVRVLELDGFGARSEAWSAR